MKTRPALVISNSSLKGNDIILSAITSQNKDQNDIPLDNTDLKTGSLPLTSYVKPGKIITIDISIVNNTDAKIYDKKLKEITDKLIQLIS